MVSSKAIGFVVGLLSGKNVKVGEVVKAEIIMSVKGLVDENKGLKQGILFWKRQAEQEAQVRDNAENEVSAQIERIETLENQLAAKTKELGEVQECLDMKERFWNNAREEANTLRASLKDSAEWTDRALGKNHKDIDFLQSIIVQHIGMATLVDRAMRSTETREEAIAHYRLLTGCEDIRARNVIDQARAEKIKASAAE